jgi:putative membrane protein
MSDMKSAQAREDSQSVGVSLFIKGVAMGIGDSVPGVSGGTIAVITNIYDKLVYSIRSVDLQAGKFFFSGNFAQAWQHINGNFLLVLATGILAGLLLSANTVLFLLENYFPPLMMFFIGLVLSSCWLLKNQFNYMRVQNLLALLAGLSVALAISFLDAREAEISYLYVFLCGAIAISAMILPGLSGAFILILLGVYEFILQALTGFQLGFIFTFMAGCAIGLMVFSRLLSWLLLKHHQLSYGCIVGMLLGSVAVLWPWQYADPFYAGSLKDQHGLTLENVSPFNYEVLSGNDPMLLIGVLCFAAGIAVVIFLHWIFDSKRVHDSRAQK